MNRATKIVITAFGLFSALAGMEHGIGEIFQGNGNPGGLFIKSWGNTELFSVLAGEPAFTVIPDFFVSGLLSISISLFIVIWVLFFLNGKHSGFVLVLLSLLLFSVGGGFGPPLIGIIVGSAGTKLHSNFPLLQKLRTTGFLKCVSSIWHYSLPAGIACFLFLLPGSIILWGVFGFYEPGAIIGVSLLAYAMILLSIASAYSHDAVNQKGNTG